MVPLPVKRYQALMQIHSRRAGAKRTDFIEQVAYTHKDGLLEHRQSADQHMGCFKSHDLDLHRALLSALAGGRMIATVKYISKHTSTEKSKEALIAAS